MRISSAISWALVIASAIVSVMLWRDLRAERQLVAELRTQLDESRTALAEARSPAQPAVTPLREEAAVATTSAEPRAPAQQILQEPAVAAKPAEMVLPDSGSKDERLARARSVARRIDLTLATELGLSVQEADLLFNILGEGVLRREEALTRLRNESLTDDARRSARTRMDEELEQQEKAAIIDALGAKRYAEVQEYQETRPARARVTNFSGMLASRGAALTEAQSKSFSRVMVAEQRRQESEASTMPADASARVEREIESDRRILAAVAGFLNEHQMAFMNSKFEELWEAKRPAAR